MPIIIGLTVIPKQNSVESTTVDNAAATHI